MPPWDKYAQQAPSAPQGDPVIAVDPYRVNAETRASEDQRLQQAAAARAEEDQAMQRAKFEEDKRQREADRAAGVNASARESENKAGAFLIRALGANKSYEGADVGPRSFVGQKIADTSPNLLNSLPGVIGNSPERQVADSSQDEFIAASLRQDSGAAIPEEEMERQRRIYFPMPGDSEQVIEQKRQARLRAIEGLKMSAGRLEGEAEKRFTEMQTGSPSDNRIAIDGEATGPEQRMLSGDGPAPLTPNASGYQRKDNPKLAGVIDEYKQRLGSGQSASEIIPWLRQRGVDPSAFPTVIEQIKDRRQNPNARLEERYGFDELDDMFTPMSATEKGMNAVGQSPVGAALIGAGNFYSGNNLDSMAGALGGDAQGVRNALAMSAQINPNATAVGEVIGGIGAAMGGEALLARAGMAPGFLRGLGADAGMGAANGAGMADNGNRVGNALLGAGTAAAGSAAGSALTRGVGRAIGPTGGNMAPLYEAGVRPTLGQRVADKGVVGRTVNATEEALQSVPVVGSAIRGARQGARDQFQIGAFNEALREVGEQLPKNIAPGTGPHAYAQRTFDRVYAEARSGMRMVGDEVLANDLSGLSEQVAQLAEPSVRRFNAIFKNTVSRRVKGGELAGPEYKAAVSDLGKRIREIRKSPSGDGELASALEDLQATLDQAARRHSDPDAVALLDAADAGYAKLVRIEDAAARRGGESGEFSPAQFDAAVQRTSGSTRSKAYLRGDALMQDYAQAGRGLEDKMPNSGTTDRALLAGGAAAGAAGYFEPSILAFLGTVGLAYAPGVRNLTKAAIAPGGPKRRAISDQLKKRARLVGAAGGASAVAALPGTSPGP